MRVKLIKDCMGPNPLYDSTKTQAQQPHVQAQIVVKAGKVLDHPKAWLHIVNGIAEPEDDEAKEWAVRNGLRMEAHHRAVEEIRQAQLEALGVEESDEGDEDDDE